MTRPFGGDPDGRSDGTTPGRAPQERCTALFIDAEGIIRAVCGDGLARAGVGEAKLLGSSAATALAAWPAVLSCLATAAEGRESTAEVLIGSEHMRWLASPLVAGTGASGCICVVVPRQKEVTAVEEGQILSFLSRLAVGADTDVNRFIVAGCDALARTAADLCAVAIVDPDGTTLRCQHSVGDRAGRVAPAGMTLARSTDPEHGAWRAIDRLETTRAHPSGRDGFYGPLRGRMRHRGFDLAHVPIVVDGHGVGIVSIARYKPGRVGPSQIDLAAAVAGQIALLLDHARLRSAVTRRSDQLGWVARLASTAILDTHPDRLHHDAARTALLVAEADAAAVVSSVRGSLVVTGRAGAIELFDSGPDRAGALAELFVDQTFPRRAGAAIGTQVIRESVDGHPVTWLATMVGDSGSQAIVTAHRGRLDLERCDVDMLRSVARILDTPTAVDQAVASVDGPSTDGLEPGDGTALGRQGHAPVRATPSGEAVLSSMVAAAARSGTALGVMICDVHPAADGPRTVGEADEHLTNIAIARISTVLRPGDSVTRSQAGDVVIVCPGVGTGIELVSIGNRLAAAVADPLAEPAGERLRCTVGATVSWPDEQPDVRVLLREAEAALHAAAHRGAAIEVFDAEARARARWRLQIERDLRHGVALGHIHATFQPVVRTGSREPVGYEAFVRWRHPTRGLLKPGDFLGVAEESGLMASVWSEVLASVIDQLRQWQKDPRRLARWISVNLSTDELRTEGLASSVFHRLQQAGVPPSCLRVDALELSFVDPRAVLALHELRAGGIKIAVDDFGTGQASFGYLRTMPVDALKIDGSFTAGVDGGGHEAALVASMVTLGRALDLEVIAEGVERATQEETLAALGCGYVQGFLIDRDIQLAGAATSAAVTPALDELDVAPRR